MEAVLINPTSKIVVKTQVVRVQIRSVFLEDQITAAVQVSVIAMAAWLIVLLLALVLMDVMEHVFAAMELVAVKVARAKLR